MVSAAIAWVRAARPSLKADQAADVVRFSARDVGTKGYDGETGYGVLNVDRALALRKRPHDPNEPNDGPALIDGSVIGRAQPFFFKGHRAGAPDGDGRPHRGPAGLVPDRAPAPALGARHAAPAQRQRRRARPRAADEGQAAQLPAREALGARRRAAGAAAARQPLAPARGPLRRRPARQGPAAGRQLLADRRR